MYVDGSLLADSFAVGLAFLIFASLVAGFIDSVAGGAGLVLVPSFILAGLPPQLALGQEKLVSTLGTLSAIFNFFKSKKILWNFVAIGVPSALIGAFMGAKAILYFDQETVGKVIASIVGNYIGSHMTIKKGDGFIKPILFGMIFLLFATMAYKYFV